MTSQHDVSSGSLAVARKTPDRSLYALLLGFVLASPSIYLAVKLYTVGLEWTYDGFFILARIGIAAMFILGGAVAGWSLTISGSGRRVLAIATFLLHCGSFAVMVHVFGGVHSLP